MKVKVLFASGLVLSIVSCALNLPSQTPAANPPKPVAKPGFTLTTNAFEDGGVIPNKYTSAATGPQVSIPLQWTNVPDGTVTFVLLMHDPETSLNHRTDQIMHWLMFNIPGTARELTEGVPFQAQLPDGSIQLVNRHKAPGYLGPGAPAPGPYHHYTFELFALDTKLNLGPDTTQADVENAMQGHILEKGVLVGRYHHP